MSENSNDMEILIQQYIDGELGEEDRLYVKNKIDIDEEWKNKAESIIGSINAIRYYGITQDVAVIHQQWVRQNTVQSSGSKSLFINRFVRYSVAVAASIILIISGIIGYEFYQLSPEKIFSENFVPYQTTLTRSEQKADISIIKKAYTNEKYKEVLDQRKTVIEKKSDDAFLVGLSYLQTNDGASAITWLHPIAVNKSDLQIDAEFYLALAYLKNEDYDKAISLMEKIVADKTHLYHQYITNKTIRQVKMLKWK